MPARKKKKSPPLSNIKKVFISAVLGIFIYTCWFSGLVKIEYRSALADVETYYPLPALDIKQYDARMFALAHVDPSATSTRLAIASSTLLWPVLKAPYPNAGAILPFKRIVAYYGNFYSSGMGILGELPDDELLAELASTSQLWQKADPTTPTLPAIQYIAVVAQANAGKEGNYILRMPDGQIDHALALAEKIKGIVFLDIQVGKSTLEHELPMLESYLKKPQVHLAIDPEFSMKYGDAPGTVIGTFDAADVNYAVGYLAKLVTENGLPPKVLVVHRFTEKMVTNFQDIRPLPEVQIVMDMDGWGPQAKKKGTYNQVIAPEPVQFTGMKLFYKNDMKPPSTGLLSAEEVLKLTPAPIYIQYQ